MIEKEQELLAKVLDLIAQRFDRKAILRGGMMLHILGSPRFTNDLDYLFVPYKSKKDIVADIVDCLSAIDEATIETSLNSKCLRVVIATPAATIQVEIKTAMEAKTTTASTRLFSAQHNLPQRLIRVLDYPVALANKMAAWNERRLIRDIYDTWFYLQMNITPDPDVLNQRLQKPNYSPLVKPANYFKGQSLSEFYDFLRNHVAHLTDKDIQQELADYLPPEEIPGLAMQFRAALARLR